MVNVLSALASRLRRARSRVLRHRRALAALAVGLAAWAALQAAMSPPSPTTPVWTLAQDLPAGAVLDRSDLERSGYLVDTVPRGAVRDLTVVLGRPLAHAAERGQPLAESMVLTQRWVDQQDGAVVPVRISDAAVVDLLRVGDLIDLYGTDVTGAAEAQSALPLATSVRIAAIPPPDETAASDALPGRLVLISMPESRVEPVTSAAARQFLSVAWSR